MRPKPNCIDHSAIECIDLEKTKVWYRDGLALNCDHFRNNMMVVDVGGPNKIVVMQNPKQKTNPSAAVHIGLTVDTIEEVDWYHNFLEERQHEFFIKKIVPPAPVGSRQSDGEFAAWFYRMYVHDLDENWFEILTPITEQQGRAIRSGETNKWKYVF